MRAQIHHDVLEIVGNVLCQVGRLLQYGTQNVAVIRIAGEGARTQHMAVFVRDHHRTLDTKLVRFFGSAFGDTLNLRRMQCIQFVLVVSLMGLNAGGTFKPEGQIVACLWLFGRKFGTLHFALHLPDDDAKNGTLAFEHAP